MRIGPLSQGADKDDNDDDDVARVGRRVMRKKNGARRCCSEISHDRSRSVPRKKAPACAKKDAIFACVYLRQSINSARGRKKRYYIALSLREYKRWKMYGTFQMCPDQRRKRNPEIHIMNILLLIFSSIFEKKMHVQR